MQSLGYSPSDINDLDEKGYTVFLNKSINPNKVELMVKTKNRNFRPKSTKLIETVAPVIGNLDDCLTTLDGIENIGFLKPECIEERLISDIRMTDGQVPSKMLEDLYIIHKYLLNSSKV